VNGTHKVILALPAYNEGGNLEPLIDEAAAVLGKAGIRLEMLVVNDGSSDNTRAVLESLAARHPVRIITHEQNRGLGGAIKTLIAASLEMSRNADDIIVNMDADNTHDPSYILPMSAKIWNEGFDVVIASRFREGSREVGVPFHRRMISRAARVVFRLYLGLPDVRDYTCGYRAYRASVLRAAHERYGDAIITRQGFACTDELLVRMSRITRKITEVPFVLRYDKKRGRSKMPFLRTVFETLRMLLGRE
jgi:dolichol-phosphate mannosyltransferase